MNEAQTVTRNNKPLLVASGVNIEVNGSHRKIKQIIASSMFDSFIHSFIFRLSIYRYNLGCGNSHKCDDTMYVKLQLSNDRI